MNKSRYREGETPYSNDNTPNTSLSSFEGGAENQSYESSQLKNWASEKGLVNSGEVSANTYQTLALALADLGIPNFPVDAMKK